MGVPMGGRNSDPVQMAPRQLCGGEDQRSKRHGALLASLGFKCQLLQSGEMEGSEVAVVIDFLCPEDNTHLIRFKGSFSK